MLEVAGGIVLAVLILVYFGGMGLLAACSFGVLLIPAALALVYLMHVEPIEMAIGSVVAAVVLGSVLREADEDREQRERRT